MGRGAGLWPRELVPTDIRLTVDATGVVQEVEIARRADDAASQPTPLTPPELRSGAIGDARSDQYSLAVITFLLLTGRSPFDGPSRVTGRSVDAVFVRALASDPAQRFPSCEDFASALTAAIADDRLQPTSTSSSRSRLVWVVAAALLLVAAIATGAVFGIRALTGSSDEPIDMTARAKEVAAHYVVGILTFDAANPEKVREAILWHTTPEFAKKQGSEVDSLIQQMKAQDTHITSTADYTDLVDDTKPEAIVVAVGVTARGSTTYNPSYTAKSRSTVTMDCTRDCLVSGMTSTN